MVYFAGLIILLICCRVKESKKHYKPLILLLTGILVWGIFSFRASTVGTDTRSYLIYFRMLEDTPISIQLFTGNTNDIFSKSSGWVILFKLIGDLFGYTDSIYLLFSGLLVVPVFFIIIGNFSQDYRVSLLLFYLIFFLPSMNGTRTFMALGLVFLSGILILWQKQKILPFLILIPAFFIHKIALVGVIIDFLFLIRWNKKRVKIAIIASIAATLLIPKLIEYFVTIFPEYRYSLIEEVPVAGKNIVYQVAYITLFVYAYRVSKQNRFRKKEGQRFNGLLMILLIEIVIGIVGWKTWYLQRINYFFQIYILILAPAVFHNKIKYRNIYKIIVYSVFAAGFFYTILANKSEIMPYRTWLFN